MLRRHRAPARVIAVMSALLFLNLEMTVLLQGHLAVSRAHAQAGKERRVALFVLSTGRNAGDAQVLQTLLRKELKGLTNVRLVTGSPDPDRSIEATAGPMVENGIRSLNDGVRSREAAAAAEAELQKAYDLLVRDTGPLNRRLLARTLKGLGVARVMLGRREEGKEMIRAALNLWPDQQDAEYGYTLEVRNAYKEVQKERLEQAAGSVAIFSEPTGAEVSIGGQVKGYATSEGINVRDLMPGPHWMSAQLDGYKRSGAFVTVEAGQETLQNFFLEPMPNAQAFESTTADIVKNFRSEAKVSGSLTGLKGLVGADEVLVFLTSSRGGAYHFNGWHLGPQGKVEQVQAKVKQDASFLTGVQNMLAGALNTTVAGEYAELPLDAPPGASQMAGGGDEVFIDPNDQIIKVDDKEKQSLTSEWWFWAILGGAAAGLTLGVLAIVDQPTSSGAVGDITIGVNPATGAAAQ